MKILSWKKTAGLFIALIASIYFVLLVGFSIANPSVSFDEIDPNAGISSLPDHFLLGAATSAHQVEGNNELNDWYHWERDSGLTPSAQAANHWNRVAGDIRLLTDLGANAYRFSIEWSRVEPSQGHWDEQAWIHYQEEIRQLRQAGIEPVVTLLHFTLPVWLAKEGGLTHDQFPERFARFAAEAARRFGEEVDVWTTINEPNVWMYQSYVQGVWPPGEKNTALASKAFAGLVRAHAAAASAIREQDSVCEIGAAINLILFEPDRKWWLPDWIAAREADKGFNWAFYDSISRGAISFHLAGFPEIEEPLPSLKDSADWFGINYYRRNLVRFSLSAPGLVTLLQGPGQLSDAGVEIYPEGLLVMAQRVWKRFRLPIIVTENGLADDAGQLRPQFLRSHLYAVSMAHQQGIPMNGYFHWSLMDNFEWSEGYRYRFGLYRIDYQNFERTPGPVVEEFRRLADQIRGE